MKGILSKGLLLGFCIFLCGCAAINTPNTICVDKEALKALLLQDMQIREENSALQTWRDKMFF